MLVPFHSSKGNKHAEIEIKQQGRGAGVELGAPLKIQILVPANLKVTLHSNFVVSQLLRYGKNFLLTYQSYVALRNFFSALYLGEL